MEKARALLARSYDSLIKLRLYLKMRQYDLFGGLTSPEAEMAKGNDRSLPEKRAFQKPLPEAALSAHDVNQKAVLWMRFLSNRELRAGNRAAFVACVLREHQFKRGEIEQKNAVCDLFISVL